MKILILGASGMLGSTLFRLLHTFGHEVHGTLRQSMLTPVIENAFSNSDNLILNIDLLNTDHLYQVVSQVNPEMIINAAGVIKQLDIVNDPLSVIPINSLLPHRISELTDRIGARLIHISTDCVFDGNKGNYLESDKPNADDLYGKSKELGEIKGKKHVLTLRTSLIGHELQSNHSLVDWFLSQGSKANGYSKAIFSGLTTVEIANVIHEKILPRPDIFGLYHMAANPINKFDLLRLIKQIYNKKIDIFPVDTVKIDRSLNSKRFYSDFLYAPPDWTRLIKDLKSYYDRYKGLDHVRQ